MAFRSFKTPGIGDTAVKIYEAQPGDVDISIQTDIATHLGGDDQVSLANGFAPQGPIWQTKVRAGDEIWAIRNDQGTSVLHFMVRSI